MSMKKHVRIFIFMIFGLTVGLVACGEKSQEDVVSKLEDNVETMEGYKATAEMTMHTGDEEQIYDIDIWHKKDDLYRVSLSSSTDEKESQVIIKNEEGVFVLTPSLDKRFKFQTDWPDNSSQPYLFQSLVNDISEDQEATFEATDNHYMFETETNYQSNNNLPYQKVYFSKKEFHPVLVQVLDRDKEALVEVNFTQFEMDPAFNEDDFSIDENMEEDSEDVAASKDQEGDDTLEVTFPLETAGAELDEKKEITLDDGKRVILTFTGEKDFTLVQEKLKSVPTSSQPKEAEGDIVNLGFTIGALADDKIEWTYNGVDFMLASEELTKEELIEVAKSVQGKEAK